MSTPDRWLTAAPLSLDALLAETEDPAAGAMVCFAGTIRDHNEGSRVLGLAYEAHPELAPRLIADLELEAMRRFEISRVRIQHRFGALDIGETAVLVVVRAAHRGAAFEAARWAIDETKGRVPIWKRETYAQGDDAWLMGVPLTPR
jgi:molybdopterin synthase catalytic subunit